MCQWGAVRNPWASYRMGISPIPTSFLTSQAGGGGRKVPLQIAANWLEVDENVSRPHFWIHCLVVKWCNEQSYGLCQSPLMSERRSSTICVVVEQPNHHLVMTLSLMLEGFHLKIFGGLGGPCGVGVDPYNMARFKAMLGVFCADNRSSQCMTACCFACIDNYCKFMVLTCSKLFLTWVLASENGVPILLLKYFDFLSRGFICVVHCVSSNFLSAVTVMLAQLSDFTRSVFVFLLCLPSITFSFS